MHLSFTLTLLLAGLIALGGCGQTGPLYLPEDNSKESPKPESVSDPALESETAA